MSHDLHTSEPALAELADCARRYCGLIESVDHADGTWLREMSHLLAGLHLAAERLEPASQGVHAIPAPDLDARFELYTHLRELLGVRDDYLLEGDLAGSLADDLTDIYCEMKHGIRLFEQDPCLAAVNWRCGYQAHWGAHLMDAARHLLGLRGRFQPAG